MSTEYRVHNIAPGAMHERLQKVYLCIPPRATRTGREQLSRYSRLSQLFLTKLWTAASSVDASRALRRNAHVPPSLCVRLRFSVTPSVCVSDVTRWDCRSCFSPSVCHSSSVGCCSRRWRRAKQGTVLLDSERKVINPSTEKCQLVHGQLHPDVRADNVIYDLLLQVYLVHAQGHRFFSCMTKRARV